MRTCSRSHGASVSAQIWVCACSIWLGSTDPELLVCILSRACYVWLPAWCTPAAAGALQSAGEQRAALAAGSATPAACPGRVAVCACQVEKAQQAAAFHCRRVAT